MKELETTRLSQLPTRKRQREEKRQTANRPAGFRVESIPGRNVSALTNLSGQRNIHSFYCR